MPIKNPIIEVKILIDREENNTLVRFENNQCSATTSAELWLDSHTGEYFLYQQEEFYDEKLRTRRNSGLMISPTTEGSKLIYVGIVRGKDSFSSDRFLLIAETQIKP